MAYSNRAFNPDALPAHVEPQQAAQLLSQHQSQAAPQPTSPTPPTRESPWAHKPPPPLPPGVQPPQRNAHSVSPHLDQGRRPSAPTSTNSYNSQHGGNQPVPHVPGAYPPRMHASSMSGPVRPGPSPGPLNVRPSPNIPQAGAPPNIPQAGSDPVLFPIFRAVDTQATGQLTEEELGKALRNGDYTTFDPETVRLMIKMFDHDHSGTIGFEEFCGLWGFLGAWRQLFDKFDADHSGYISLDEFSNALVAFGYHLTPSFVEHMYARYDRHHRNTMNFDIFVQSCISLKRMTDVFKRYDTDRDGFVTMSFEEFLNEVLNLR